MTYENFEKFVREQCMYETIYDDSDGRRILVMRLLDAYDMVNTAIAAEREACAKVVEAGTGQPIQTRTLEILRQERERIAFVIRERGAP